MTEPEVGYAVVFRALLGAVAWDTPKPLALYTDGLIERRHEDIDTGPSRLADSLVRNQADDPETCADAVLTDLLPPGDATDDTALVMVRLRTQPTTSVCSVRSRGLQRSHRRSSLCGRREQRPLHPGVGRFPA